MILAAILRLFKLEGEDVKINFGIHNFWTQHTQIDVKNLSFYLEMQLTSLSSPFPINSPNL